MSSDDEWVLIDAPVDSYTTDDWSFILPSDSIDHDAYVLLTGNTFSHDHRFCEACQMWLRDDAQLAEHLATKKHTRNVRPLRRVREVPGASDKEQAESQTATEIGVDCHQRHPRGGGMCEVKQA